MAVTNYYTINGEIIGEAASGVRTGYLPDALESVTATVDEAGAVENTYRYKPYGTQLSKSGVGADPKFRWVGKMGYRNSGDAGNYVRARHYRNGDGAWNTVDPIWPLRTPFGYAGGNPVGRFDYFGLSSDSVSCQPGEHPCATYSGGPCAYAIEIEGLADGGDYGAPICCDGKPYICLMNLPPGTDEDIIECLTVHEKSHLDFGSCEGVEGYREFLEDWDLEIGGTPPPGGGECGAYLAELACYASHFNWGNRDKIWEFLYWICTACEQMKFGQCKNRPKLCGYCDEYYEIK